MVSLQSLAPSLKRRFSKLFGPRVEVIWLRATELDSIAGDLVWVEDVLFDMAVRARTALPFGGRLVIEWANIKLDPSTAEGQGLAEGRFVMLEMTCLRQDPSTSELPSGSSTVARFPDEWLHCDFSQAKAMIQSVGGQICEYNEPGRALTIRAFFPSTEEMTELKSFDVNNEMPHFRILLVEDEAYVRDVACEILESEGYEVLAARTGQEAINLYEQSRPVQLLLTDVVMPGMTGHDLANHLMSRDPELKTIYMSGYMDGLGAQTHRHDSRLPFIQKPFTLESLTAVVKQVLNSPQVT